MKTKLFLIFIFFKTTCLGQAGMWTWMKGDTISTPVAVYGTQGIPSPLNMPPGEYEPAQWTDQQGNVWLFGGVLPNPDLWKLDMQTLEWTWVGGTAGGATTPVYGTKGVASPLNWPKSTGLYSFATWADTSNNLWLMEFQTSVLWKYDIAIGEWTWVNGDTTINSSPVYGTQGIPSPLNSPASRG